MSENITNREENGNIAVICAYNKEGICILSDCRCQATSDGKLICASFKVKQQG